MTENAGLGNNERRKRGLTMRGWTMTRTMQFYLKA